MAGKKKEESFKLDNSITYYLNDYVDNKDKQRKIIENNNGSLFYIFTRERKVQDECIMGES